MARLAIGQGEPILCCDWPTAVPAGKMVLFLAYNDQAYPTSASGITVLSKTTTKFHSNLATFYFAKSSPGLEKEV